MIARLLVAGLAGYIVVQPFARSAVGLNRNTRAVRPNTGRLKTGMHPVFISSMLHKTTDIKVNEQIVNALYSKMVHLVHLVHCQGEMHRRSVLD